MFLYDVKCITKELHIEGTGVSNKLILENLKKLSNNFRGDIIIRIPVMIGFNDDADEMKKIADFLKNSYIRDIELLTYHRMGEHKYASLGMDFTVYSVPDEETMTMYKKVVSSIRTTT